MRKGDKRQNKKKIKKVTHERIFFLSLFQLENCTNLKKKKRNVFSEMSQILKICTSKNKNWKKTNKKTEIPFNCYLDFFLINFFFQRIYKQSFLLFFPCFFLTKFC